MSAEASTVDSTATTIMRSAAHYVSPATFAVWRQQIEREANESGRVIARWERSPAWIHNRSSLTAYLRSN